jgi:uncharacterized protein (TIGR02453 family)
MLQKSTLAFLEQLARNNNKPWFEKNKEAYTNAKEDFEQFVTTVLTGLSTLDPSFKQLTAKDCVMRIYRDVRFSKDKSPYKLNFGAGFSSGGKKFPGAGYYLHVEPGKCFAGGGIWQPEGAMLKAIRQEIDYGFDEFRKILAAREFKKNFAQIDGDKLVKVPMGYGEDNPAIEYLRLKSFTVSGNLSDADMTNKKAAAAVNEVFAAMKPFVDFLNRAVG